MPTQRRVPSLSHPVMSREHAIAVVQSAMVQPPRPETTVLFLNHDLSCTSAVTVTGTVVPEAIIDVAEVTVKAAATQQQLSGLVFATVRPYEGVSECDTELWFDINDIANEAGVAVIDWLIFGRFGIFSPREMLGLASRWAA
jgi:DNA repair protein RadC